MMPMDQKNMKSGGDMGKSMKQHQMDACKECTPKENAAMTAANKPPANAHPMSGKMPDK